MVSLCLLLLKIDFGRCDIITCFFWSLFVYCEHFSMWSQDGGVVECLPDYIVYRDKYSTDSVVTFSNSYIKIEGYWQAENFEFQWGVDHIMNIECQWCERVSY